MSYASTEDYEAEDELSPFQLWCERNGYELGDQSNSEREQMLFQWRMFGKKEMKREKNLFTKRSNKTTFPKTAH